jgi:cysteine desulfurase
MKTSSMRVYFDYNATTPVTAEVIEATMRATRDIFGNPSSVHHFGQQAKAAMDEARTAVADLIGAEPTELVFTSGGTEADNFAIRGLAEALEPTGRRHLIASAIEHEAVLNTFKALARRGWRTTLLPVGASGVVELDALRAALTDDTALVSVMHANNEIGTVQPIAELATLAHERGALFHTDAVQAAGKLPVDVGALGIDVLALSAHKFNGPKGVGAIWIRRGTRMLPILTGGKHERNRRAGTENVAGIVGFGVAAELAAAEVERAAELAALRDELESRALEVEPDTMVVSGRVARLPNTSCLAVPGTKAETLVIGLDLAGVAVSAGSACSSGKVEASHVLSAMGLTQELAQGAIRVSLGFGTVSADIERFIGAWSELIKRMRQRQEAALTAA